MPGGFYDGIILFNDLNKTFKINILSSIDSMDIIKDYGLVIDFNATFYDAEGNVLANKEVLFIINGNDYFVKTDDKGMAILNNQLYPGDYTIMSVNPATGETKEFN